MHRIGYRLIKFVVFFFIILIQQSINAQKAVEWHVLNKTFIDNREYFNSYAKPQTIFGTRLDLSAGFSIDSVHSVQAGADFLYEFGSSNEDIKISPTIYYHYNSKDIEFLFGAFPRHKNLEYPKILHNDTLYYYRPNLEGSMVGVKRKSGFQKLWIDWTGRQTATVNESFMAGSFGIWNFENFFIKDYFYMYHHAGTLTEKHVRDNAGALILLGVDLSETYYLKLAAGLAYSDDRVRPDPFNYSFGFYSDIEFNYKYYTARFVHYNGKPISLAQGDPFYKAGVYSRLDGEILFIDNKYIQLNFQASFHFETYNMDSSQKLELIIMLDRD